MRRNPLIAAIAVVLGLAVLAFGIVFPRGREVTRIRSEVADAEAGLAGVEAQLASLESVDAAAVARDLGVIREQIPSSAALPDLLRVLDRAAAIADVSLTSIGVGAGAASSAASVSVISLTLSAQGGYFALARFLFELEHLGRLSVVRSVSLSPSGERGLTASISADVFTTDPSVGPGSGAEGGPEVGA